LQRENFSNKPIKEVALVENGINPQQILLEEAVEPRWQQGLANQDYLMKLLPWLKESDEGYL
jgi:hypothetical protein